MSDTIRVSLGSEPSQFLNARILRSSIIRRSSRPVEFSTSWDEKQDWHPLTKTLPKIKNGTKFALWRWLVPEVYNHSGKAIYLDADQICFADIAELWESLPEGKSIACVTHAEGVFGNKVPEKGKNQTSVMVMDCSAGCFECSRQVIESAASSEVGTWTYKGLMQADWIINLNVAELDYRWNLFGIDHPEKKLIHFSHVSSQPQKNPDHPIAGIWFQELLLCLQDKHVTMDEIKAEVKAGHVNSRWWKMLV